MDNPPRQSEQDGAEVLEEGEYVGPASDLPRLNEAMARQNDLLTVPAPCGTRLDWYRAMYQADNTMYNSVWRSGHSNWSQCYHFTFGPTVHTIEIR